MLTLNETIVFLWMIPVGIQIFLPLAIMIGWIAGKALGIFKQIESVNKDNLAQPVFRPNHSAT